MIDIVDSERVRVIRLNRPEVKNAMNEALWDATAEAFIEAEQQPVDCRRRAHGVG